MTVENMQNGSGRETPNERYESLRRAFVGAQLEDLSYSPIRLDGLADKVVANAKENRLDPDGCTRQLMSLHKLLDAANEATSEVAKRDTPTLTKEFEKFALWL